MKFRSRENMYASVRDANENKLSNDPSSHDAILAKTMKHILNVFLPQRKTLPKD